MPHEVPFATVSDAIGGQELNLLQAVMESTVDAYFVTDLTGKCIYCNAAGECFFGRPLPDIIGQNAETLLGPEAAGILKDLDRLITASDTSAAQEILVAGPTVSRVYQVTRSPYRDAQGMIRGTIGIARELTTPLEAEETIRQIAAGNSATGKDYLHSVVSQLCRACRVDLAFIGVLATEIPQTIETRSVCQHGKLIDNFQYPLHDAPCENVVGTKFCFYPTGVQELFPHDTMLVQFGIDSYMGIPLFSSSGAPLGLIALLHSQPFPLPERSQTMLEIVAARAEAEMERVLVEDQLRASEARYRSFVENTSEAFFVHDRHGKVIDVNQQACTLLGFPRDELVGLMPFAYDPSLTSDELKLGLAQLDQGQKLRRESRLRRKDGTEFPVHVQVSPFFLRGSRCAIATVQDTSERQQAEATLKRHLFELTVLNHVGTICSEGISADDILCRTTRLVADALYPENCGFMLLDETRQVLTLHGSFVLTAPDKDGRDIPVQVGLVGKAFRTGQPIRIGDVRIDPDYLDVDSRTHSEMCIPLRTGGKVIGVMNIESVALNAFSEADERLIIAVLDLLGTSLERLRMEQALQKSEIRFRELVDAIPQIVWIAGPDGAILHLNDKTTEYSGIAADQLTGWQWGQIIHPDDLATTVATWQTCLRNGISADIVFRVRRYDGMYRWHICREVPVRDTSGKIDSWYGTCTDIEDLKRAEQSLRESEERFRLLFEGAADAIFWADAETGLLTQCNGAAELLLGRARHEIVGQHHAFLHSREEFARYQELFRLHAASKSNAPIEVEVLRKDGRRVDVAISPSVTTIDGHRVIQAIFRDISIRKQTEQSLQMMRFCIDHASDSVFWISRQGRILYVNTAACKERGYTREELLTMSISDLDVKPDYQPAAWGQHFDELKRRGSMTLFTQHRAKNGRIFPIEVNANYVHMNNQELNFAFARDITARVQREQKIAQFAAIVESSDDAIFGTTLEGKITSWNGGAEKVFGYAEADVLGSSIHTLIQPNRAGEIPQVLTRIAKGNPMEHFDTIACRSDGSEVDVALSISAVRDTDARLTGASVVARNVTERKRAEAARDRIETDLRRSEERFTRLFYSSPFSILVATYPEGKIVEVNHAFLRLFQFELSEVIGKTTGELNIWVDPEARVTMVDRLQQANSARDMEIAFRTKSGAVLTLLMSVEIIHLQGQPHSLAMSIDITSYRQIEEQLRQSQKMEAIGQLAGGVAHDFNNLLTVINGYCDILLAEKSENNHWAASVIEIREAGRRAAALTEQLLAFSRRSYAQRSVVQLNDVVSGAEKLLRRLIGEHIIFSVNLAPERYAIQADVNQLEQVLMNLVVNGRDAMPEGGVLTITTRSVCVPDSQILHGSGMHASHVQLDVTDTGGGMSDEIRTRVFEPFFTTKESGKGSGLGLAVVHGIVQQNGGTIHVASAPGEGTTFSLLFPIVDASHTEEGARKHHRMGQGSETILLVEDEPGVRKFTRTVLEIQGYHVLEATNGKEAVALAENSRIPIHLLLTDVVMPGIDGRLVADKIRVNNPELRVIYISGYNEVEQFHGNMQNSMDLFLKKPFSPEELLRKVRDHIDAGLN